MAVLTETVSNRVGHFIILKNPNEWTGNHIRKSDEGWMRDIIDKYSDQSKVALDIGSCFGLHGLYMSRKFRRVLAFEPQKMIAEIAKRTFRLNWAGNVEVFNIACSDVAGTMRFPAINYNGINNVGGLSAAYDVGPDRNTNAGWDGISTVSVPSDTIDAIMEGSLRGDSIGFVKIDVEGFEYRTIKGAAKTLRQFLCPLAIEIKDFPEGNRLKVQELLTDIGYTDWQRVGNSQWDFLYTSGVGNGAL